MSQQLISLSADLKRLRDEGYDIEIKGGFLLLHHVPYVTPDCSAALGTLVSSLTLSGDTTAWPDTHVMQFAGQTPCNSLGQPLVKIINSEGRAEILPGFFIDCTFSSKPTEGYANYYEKMTTYARILLSEALAIDSTVTATPFLPVEEFEEEAPFCYVDTASSRANIGPISQKLMVGQIAIVGVGGTGSYVLDFLAKAPVGALHLFDGDGFHSHNAFRAPGAAALEELRAGPTKVEYFTAKYSKLRRSVVGHPYFIDASNVDELRSMDFVFLCTDGGANKEEVVRSLVEWGVPFIDTGMGLYEESRALGGTLRVTLVTSEMPDIVEKRIPMGADSVDNEYSRNIQIVELNALNAALAVIKWKKYVGFYTDLEHERFSAYDIDGNCLTNEERLE